MIEKNKNKYIRSDYLITEEDGIVATFIKKLINNWQLEKAINNTWKYYTIFINLKEKYK